MSPFRQKQPGPLDEQTLMTQAHYDQLEDQRLYTEQEALQEEIFTRIPGTIKLLMQYELRPLLKIIGAVALMILVYIFIGWDAVMSAVALFSLLAVLSYLIQSKNQDRDSTLFVEMKLPGQKITTGDHSPYSKTFFTTEKRFAVWEVPNTLIRNDMFHIPGEQQLSMLPGTGQVVFTDLFDRINRTCVLPRDMDVANICLVTNANPMLARKMNIVSEQIKLDKRTERTILDLYSTGHIKESEAKEMLKPISIRQKAFMLPTNETKRDIFFELQQTIPMMREKLQEISNKIFILADFLAARGIYQITNRPMPPKVRKDHEMLAKIMGLPHVEDTKKLFDDDL